MALKHFKLELAQNKAILRSISEVKKEYGGGYQLEIATINDLENMKIKVQDISKELLDFVGESAQARLEQTILTKNFIYISLENGLVRPYNNNGRQAFSYSADKAFTVSGTTANAK